MVLFSQDPWLLFVEDALLEAGPELESFAVDKSLYEDWPTLWFTLDSLKPFDLEARVPNFLIGTC